MYAQNTKCSCLGPVVVHAEPHAQEKSVDWLLCVHHCMHKQQLLWLKSIRAACACTSARTHHNGVLLTGVRVVHCACTGVRTK